MHGTMALDYFAHLFPVSVLKMPNALFVIVSQNRLACGVTHTRLHLCADTGILFKNAMGEIYGHFEDMLHRAVANLILLQK